MSKYESTLRSIKIFLTRTHSTQAEWKSMPAGLWKRPIFHLEYAIGQMRACHQSHGCFLTDLLKENSFILLQTFRNPNKHVKEMFYVNFY